MSLYFKLFSNCILTKGYQRATIIDTQRNDIFYIPLDLYEILIQYDGCSINQINEKFGTVNTLTINEYFNFLEKNELIFWTDHPSCFPNIDLNWDYPAKITNAILDFDSNSKYNYQNVINQLCSDLYCDSFLLRFYSSISINELRKILFEFSDSKTKSIDLIFPIDKINIEDAIGMIKENPRIRTILISNAEKNELAFDLGEDLGNIFLTTATINSPFYGMLMKKDITDLIFNLKFISESIQYNNFLNRKMSVDKDGYIKNVPSFKHHFGHVKNTKLLDAYNNPEFKQYWNLSADKLDVCKDCEYKYCCLSYIEDINDFNPQKFCNYDPYKAVWKEN